MATATITPEGLFWQRVSEDCCPVCEKHSIIIVQKLGMYYAIHTRVALNVQLDQCIHVWRRRLDDPPCLSAFEPTSKVPKTTIDSNALTAYLRRG